VALPPPCIRIGPTEPIRTLTTADQLRAADSVTRVFPRLFPSVRLSAPFGVDQRFLIVQGSKIDNPTEQQDAHGKEVDGGGELLAVREVVRAKNAEDTNEIAGDNGMAGAIRGVLGGGGGIV
jgi:hypothetical protein